jgi:hypothetical protein
VARVRISRRLNRHLSGGLPAGPARTVAGC